jgi:hypothetical protein
LVERGAISGFLREGARIIAMSQPEILALCGEPVGVPVKPPAPGADRRTVEAMVAFHRDGDRAPARAIADMPDDDVEFRDYVEEAAVIRSCLGDDAARAFLLSRSPTAMAYMPFCAAAWLVVLDDQARAYQAHQAAPRLFIGDDINEQMYRLYWAQVLREALLDDEARAVITGVERAATEGWILASVANAFFELDGDATKARRVLEAAERSRSLTDTDREAIAKSYANLRTPV